MKRVAACFSTTVMSVLLPVALTVLPGGAAVASGQERAGAADDLLKNISNSSDDSAILHTVNWGSARPDITAIIPASGKAGGTVIISGCGFGAARGASNLFFGGFEAASGRGWPDGAVKATVPDGETGACKVAATTVADSSTAMGFTVAAPVSLTSINPVSGKQFDMAVRTKLTGNGFRPGATVCLVKGDVVIESRGVNVASGNEITCTIGLSGVEPGAYDIVVTNQDGGMAAMAGGFTLTAARGPSAGTTALTLGSMLGLLSLGRGLKRRRRR